MTPKPKRPNYTGSLASYKESVADKPKGLNVPSPSDVVNYASSLVNTARAAAGQTTNPRDKGVRTLGMGISLANTAINPYSETTKKLLGAAVNRDRQSLTALSKSAALDAAITGTAIGVVKGVQAGINVAANSGIPARIGNKITGQTVLVHGSPVRGIQELKPSYSRAMPNDLRVFGMRTDVPLNVQGSTQSVATGYATGSSWVDKGKTLPPGGGSIYVVKTPKKTTELPAYPKVPKTPQFTESGRPIIQLPPSVATNSASPGKVSGEITVQGKTAAQIQAALRAELKKAGAKVDPNILQKMMNKAEAKKLAARARNNPSVV